MQLALAHPSPPLFSHPERAGNSPTPTFNHPSHGESGEVRGERVTDMGDRDPDDDAARGLIRMVRGLTLR